MWLEEYMLSVKAKSQAGNIWARYNDNTKKAKATRYPDWGLINLCILPRNSAEGLRPRRGHCWHYAESVFENTPKNLVVQGRVHLEHRSHIVKVGVWGYILTRQSLTYTDRNEWTSGPIWNYATETLTF